jgi:hypothetical protein
MNGIIFLVIVLLVAGIILFSETSKVKKRTREQFHVDLAKYLEGALEPIEDAAHPNSFRIRFKYSGEDFVFEDFEKEGFKDKVYNAHLKVKTPSKFTLTFTEKKRSSRIRSDIFFSSEISSQQAASHIQLLVPKHLNDLNVFTNDGIMANKLFETGKVSSILKQLKNTDSRAYPYMPLEIVDGVIVLEFYSDKMLQPNLLVLYNDISSMEGYLEKMMVFVRALQREL